MLNPDRSGRTTILIEVIIKLLCGKFPFMAGKDFTPELGKVLNSKKVSDHHAIIPTMELAKTDLAMIPLAASTTSFLSLIHIWNVCRRIFLGCQ